MLRPYAAADGRKDGAAGAIAIQCKRSCGAHEAGELGAGGVEGHVRAGPAHVERGNGAEARGGCGTASLHASCHEQTAVRRGGPLWWRVGDRRRGHLHLRRPRCPRRARTVCGDGAAAAPHHRRVHGSQNHHTSHYPPALPDSRFPSTLQRPQFLVRVAFAMTINKSQGLTLTEGAVIDLEGGPRYKPAGKHGLAFVAFTKTEIRNRLFSSGQQRFLPGN